uniref:Uncharacterized protein n=1 Tax=Megaselia scalaris TaxID=36166 RepID=T1H444_MEGSC
MNPTFSLHNVETESLITAKLEKRSGILHQKHLTSWACHGPKHPNFDITNRDMPQRCIKSSFRIYSDQINHHIPKEDYVRAAMSASKNNRMLGARPPANKNGDLIMNKEEVVMETFLQRTTELQRSQSHKFQNNPLLGSFINS